jgi:hypothetical protein
MVPPLIVSWTWTGPHCVLATEPVTTWSPGPDPDPVDPDPVDPDPVDPDPVDPDPALPAMAEDVAATPAVDVW